MERHGLPSTVALIAGSTLGANGLTARASLDQLELTPVKRSMSSVRLAHGGYVIQQAEAAGLNVVADRIRAAVPARVDGLADGAVIDAAALGAVADNGGLAVVHQRRP